MMGSFLLDFDRIDDPLVKNLLPEGLAVHDDLLSVRGFGPDRMIRTLDRGAANVVSDLSICMCLF